jgi:lipoprotein-anchoring transpeptidase ErfK/SrfK
VEHLPRRVVERTALASEAVERAGEFDDFDIAFCVAWSAGRGDCCVRIHQFRAPALAQQVAINTEDGANVADQTTLAPSSDEEPPADAETRQVVPFHTSEAPGTIIVDTGGRYLYLVQPNDKAIRYGIGVGRLGFQSSGVERVSQKQEWPDWRVPAEMIGRQPYLPRFMAGGPGNPLGARALYLGHTVFRIHGTNQPETIGHAVSSGCIRLDNADVIDLYDRVQVGAKVLVKQSSHVS